MKYYNLLTMNEKYKLETAERQKIIEEQFNKLKELYPVLSRKCSKERFEALAHKIMEANSREDSSYQEAKLLHEGQIEHIFMRVINDFM